MQFLVLADDWDEHPSSCQHLFRHISQKYKVLWVNTIGMRNPKLALTDFHKAVNKMRKMFDWSGDRNPEELSGNGVVACQPPMLPFVKLPGVRRINKATVRKSVRKRLAELGMGSPMLVATVPNACDFIGDFGESKVIYYCVDDFSEWPGLEKKMVKKMEAQLIEKSDSLVATSQKLFDRLAGSGKPTYLLTHGVDAEFFRQNVAREHALLNGIPRPRVGYYGLFDERSDHDLLAQLAQRMPDVSFVITGRVESFALPQKKIPNVYFTGSVPYGELPAMIKGWDVLILPYLINDLTDAISPLKLKEYLAAGKPVVSSPIPEVLKMREYVFLARTAEEWEKHLRSCLFRPEGVNRMSPDRLLLNETWEKKAEEFLGICRE